MAGEVEELGIEADGVAAALQHDALQVVVPELAGHPLPRLEGVDMAPQEVAHRGVEVEAQEDASREAENHHEAHQRAFRTADLHLAEVSPVDLGLLAGKGLQAQISLGRRLRPLGRDHVAEVALAPLVAALAHHLVEPAGGQLRIASQCLADEGHEGIELRAPVPPRMPKHSVVGQYAPDRDVMDAELACDGADLPLLGVMEAQDLRARLLVDGHLTPLAPGAGPGAGPDRRSGRRTGRSGGSGRHQQAACARRVFFRDASSAPGARQNDGARGSKGDASLSARSTWSAAPDAGADHDSVAGAARACVAPEGCLDSAARHDAAPVCAPSYCSPVSSRCCRGRSGAENHLSIAVGTVEQAAEVRHRGGR